MAPNARRVRSASHLAHAKSTSAAPRVICLARLRQCENARTTPSNARSSRIFSAFSRAVLSVTSASVARALNPTLSARTTRHRSTKRPTRGA